MRGLSAETWRVVRRIQALARWRVEERFAGSFRSVFRGEGLEFAEVREYQPGDDVRSVDWNVTARTGRPHVKRFEEERLRAVWLVVDGSPSMAAGFGSGTPRELAAEVCGVLGVSAALAGDAVGAVLFGADELRRVPAARGVDHALRIVREAASGSPRNGTDLEAALKGTLPLARRHAVVFVVSDFLQPPAVPSLAIAARKFDLVAVSVQDTLTPLDTVRAVVRLEDPETGERRDVDLADARVREAILDEERRRSAEWRHRFEQVGAGFVELRREDGWTPLVQYFERRQRRP